MKLSNAIATVSLGVLVNIGAATSQEPTRENLIPAAIPSEAKTTKTNNDSRRIMIEIQGAVLRPGVYAISPETRIYEAIERAGGLVDHAEIRDINIASRLIDGSVLSIPYQHNYNNHAQATAAQLNPPAYTRSAVPMAPVAATERNNDSGGEVTPKCININSASQKELEALPGVGEKTAQKILQYRALQPFEQIEDLLNVQGIGEKRLASWQSQLCL